MDENSHRQSASSPAHRRLDHHNWLVILLSLAGVLFMLLGLLALALPTAHEGMPVYQLDAQHTLYMMDLAGTFVLVLGLLLVWIGSRFWNRYVIS